MSKYYGNTTSSESRHYSSPRHRKPWITVLKVCCWVLGVLVILAGCALWIISAYLSPENIKRLIEEKSSEYIDGNLLLGRLDYKLFSTWPWLEFEVDSLTVISHSLDSISRKEKSMLPSDADILATVATLKGEINVHSLLKNKINLRNIGISKPEVNIVIVNDSIANFNIVSTPSSPSKIPEIAVSEIKVEAPVNFNFFSLQQDLSADLNVESFYFEKIDNKDYLISFAGLAEGHFQEYELPGKLPIKFKTEIRPEFPDIALTLKNLSLSLAGITLDMAGEFKVGKQDMNFRELELDLRIDDVFALLSYLPSIISEKVKIPDGITGILPLDFSVRLLSPFSVPYNIPEKFSLENFPAVTGTIRIEDADITLMPPGIKKINADDIYLEALYNFNPEFTDSTNVLIRQLRVKGEGISLAGDASINNLLCESQEFEGNFDFNSPLMETLTYFIPTSTIKIAGFLKGHINFNGTARQLGKEGLTDLQITGDLHSHSLKIAEGKTNSANLKNLSLDFNCGLPAYPLTDYCGTRLGLNLKADTIKALSNGSNLLLSYLDIRFDATDTVTGSPDPFGVMDISLKNIQSSTPSLRLALQDTEINIKGSLNSNGQPSYPSIAATKEGEDALIASRVNHTPLLLEYQGGGMLQTIMTMLNIDGVFKSGKGYFESPQYLYPVSISSLSAATDLNNLDLNAEGVSVGSTGLAMNATLQGLKPFLTSYSATPIKAYADISFSNVDINQLSWGYYGAAIAQGKDSVFNIPPATPYTSSDSICVVIPRNIDATVRLSSRAAEYMQYNFAPLSTEIIVKEGAATLKGLTVGTPYCKAVVDWTYSTSSLNNIFMDLEAKVENFNFEPFYKVFPQLTAKAPELVNFTGEINSDISCRFNMFPDMFMNPESLRGRFNVAGSELQFARSGKIEKITHLMLIHGDEPIHIRNMNITGGFHDNLLQVNPFKISFDDYELEFGGVNNLAGDMYYHIALEKSPFHVPFGVSVFGKMKHPEIRLGGTRINDYKAEMVASDELDRININIMSWLHRGWLMFVQEAAKYEGNLKE